MTQPFTLIGLDIEGDWNRPLIENAAAVSGCGCIFARSTPSGDGVGANTANVSSELLAALQGYRTVIACEPTRRSVSIYDFPAPRSKTAVIVGNERTGIPRKIMNQADVLACVPMANGRLSSVNVAVAASIVLYALTRDLGRKHKRRAGLSQANVDVLVHAPADPHEIGSLLRSVYAFGWRRVFIHDPNGVWFSEDPQIVLASRAAARRANNMLAVLPADELIPTHYDAVLACDGQSQGTALSRLQIPECHRLLLVIGPSTREMNSWTTATRVMVDLEDRSVSARSRHFGSILLSMISQMIAP
jgi:tRNA C32,U32 (ribose-2'-O)-methylase TrmJ